LIQMSPEDIAFSLKLAKLYMYKPSTTILAVVNPERDIQLPLVRDIVNSELAIHRRTLGVMTRPVYMQEADARKLCQVSCNNYSELRLGLGWHVTQCPRLLSTPEHENFQKTDIWPAPQSADLGVPSLRKKLSDMLFHSIQRELPRLLSEMTCRMIQVCEGNGETYMQT